MCTSAFLVFWFLPCGQYLVFGRQIVSTKPGSAILPALSCGRQISAYHFLSLEVHGWTANFADPLWVICVYDQDDEKKLWQVCVSVMPLCAACVRDTDVSMLRVPCPVCMWSTHKCVYLCTACAVRVVHVCTCVRSVRAHVCVCVRVLLVLILPASCTE